MTEENKIYLIALSNIKGLSNRTLNELIKEYKNPKNLFNDFPIEKISEVKKKKIECQLKSIENISYANNIIRIANENKISIVGKDDNMYPSLLKECEDHPVYLFVKGNLNLNKKTLISVVGTRNVSSYGIDFCKELAYSLKDYDIGIVSGLAYGVDFEIHKRTLDLNISNIGVLGSGIKNIYPYAHQKISNRILENGLLISENTPYAPPVSYNFPKRNRIIAGMTMATIIIESPLKGGSMITAKLANDYNRDVYAVPGNYLNEKSKGCNDLIKNHQAYLLDDPSEIIETLELKKINTNIEKYSSNEHKTSFDSKEEDIIYNLILNEKEVSFDKILQLTNLPFSALNELLLKMELNSLIKQFPGKIYTL